MKKRIVAIVVAIMACVSLLAMPVSALTIGNSNDKSQVVETKSPDEVVKAITSDPSSKDPVALATVKSASGTVVATIEIIPANAIAAANMSQAELMAAIATITNAVGSVELVPSAAAAATISAVKAASIGTLITPISFKVDATFAFPVQVSIKVASTPAGDYTVYYINDAGKITEAGSATVSSGGVAKFTISRSADYFLSSKSLSNKAMAGTNGK